MDRTIVLRKTGSIGSPAAVTVDFPTMLDGSTNHLPTMGQINRLHGPLAFRRLLGISAIRMRALLEMVGYQVQHHQAIYTWERAEREPRNLPKHYWDNRYMCDDAVAAYRRLIAAFVEWASRGVYRARVTGKRLWHVALRRVR